MGRQRAPAKRRKTTSNKSTRPRGGAFFRPPAKSKTKILADMRREKKRPKKAMGAYMYFCKLNRKKVQTSNPTMTFGEIGRVLGSQWCTLTDKEKKVSL
ncbi:protein MpHMGBOX4 [Marchantia polymorpha subsp. ruderalis]|uniref:HMG box domain-containing protein n=1 Tax=Marchantia polymorpha TaxID=3197 RepID=A0A2R6X7L1_MARPO|nr:hypothetical protein MARPO_0031s0059 [Marchantia polymorpha]BBN01030.1 hypothetical protein Mp_2g04030 [Marchantia polymorpha subsp. ruderalis]|eukprot:PTQ42079.1 hypothetical protein MARPO_0031s0059 [Marchantia polymorpha]